MFLPFVKRYLTRLPYAIGEPIARIPYDYRPGLGRLYRLRKKEIDELGSSNIEGIQSFVLSRIKEVVTHAYENIPFYNDLYNKNGISPSDIRSFRDIQYLPVINKSMLQGVPLDLRSAKVKGRSLVNTGGSSGHPLEFYIEPSSIPHEWAHMHRIWESVGFSQNMLKIVFGGRSNIKGVVEYDSARHSLSVDIYKGWAAIADSLENILEKRPAFFLHGYPSAIFDFVLWLETHEHRLLQRLQQSIKGMLLGSELPDNRKRTVVEELLECGSISWYGHTERSVLAYEKFHRGEYRPFPSYGFAEAVLQKNGYKLVATSFYNRASPLIRYDTGDFINPVIQNDLLQSFSISQGREGEFILDKHHNKIFLTALIFGRHHELFHKSSHIQVSQKEPGSAEILVVPRTNLSSAEASDLFDTSNVSIDFQFSIIQEPYRTVSGKVPLLVKGM